MSGGAAERIRQLGVSRSATPDLAALRLLAEHALRASPGVVADILAPGI